MRSESSSFTSRIFGEQTARRLLFVLILLAGPALAQQFFPAAPREVLVKFRAAAPASAVHEVTQSEDIEKSEPVGGAGVLRMRSRSKDAWTLVRRLSARPDVAYAEPNYIVSAIGTPNDSLFGNLWGLQNKSTPGADISAVPAWDLSTGTTGNVVAVIDTGIDYTHPDLAPNVWSAPAPFTVTIAGQTLTCPAGSHGFNAIKLTCDPLDDNNHGTHVSGTIGAAGNNGIGVVGVNWSTAIIGAKFLDARGSGYTSDAINSIEFVIQARQAFAASGGANVRVLSNSWGGGGFSQAMLDEIDRANANGMLFVAAAGNSSADTDVSPFYPAGYGAPNVVAVAATTSNDSLASFSNYGATSVDLGAPGDTILSTIKGGSYAYYSGTSMATPHVSGAAALVLSVCALDTAGLKTAILNSVDPVPALSGKTLTGGRLNVYRAMSACKGTPDFSISASPASQSVTAGASTAYTVTISAIAGFSNTVSLSVSGLPAGATAGFSPASVSGSGSSTLSVATGSSTPAGTYPLTITGSSGSLAHTTAVSLVVGSAQPPAPAGDFSLSASPNSASIPRGGSAQFSIAVNATAGFTGTVTFSATGLPGGAKARFDPASSATGASMTITTNRGTKVGTYSLTVAGAGGGLTRTVPVTLIVK